jgi:LacI family transcriptional regulator
MDQFYVMAINGAENVAEQEKYHVIISQSQEDPAREEVIIDLMKRNRVDGLIVAMTKNREDMEPFKKMENIGIPVVFVARPPKDDTFDHVTSDNEGGAFKATEYLIKKGHTYIGHIMGPESMAVSHTRLAGYKRALEKYNIPFHDSLVKSVNLTAEATFVVMDEFMKMKAPPTAFFTFKNYISLDAIEYLKKNHPDKVDLIDFAGFGNLPLFQYLDKKPIASIEENSYEMGEKAANLLFEIIKGQQSLEARDAQHIQIDCNLLVHK